MEGRINKHGFRTANAGRWSWHFLVFYVCSWLSWELCKNPTQLPKVLTHLVIIFTALCPGLDFLTLSAPESHSQLTASVSHSWLTMSFVLSSSFAGFCGHSSLCSFHAKVDKGAPLDTLTPLKDTQDKIPSLAIHPWTHTQRPTHISIYLSIYLYIYIYIYIYIYR